MIRLTDQIEDAKAEIPSAQLHAAFAQKDQHQDLLAKATALCFSLVMNTAFVDGYKRLANLQRD